MRGTWGLFVATTCAALLGCQTKTGPGGPGATKPPTGTTSTDRVDTKETFKLAVPSIKTDVKQGEQDEVTVSIDRGKDFNESVRLEFKAPQGVVVKPQSVEIPPTESNAKITVEASPDAPVGDTNVEVTAVPESGKPVSARIPIQIARRG